MTERIAECPWCYMPVRVDDRSWLNGTPELRAHMQCCPLLPPVAIAVEVLEAEPKEVQP